MPVTALSLLAELAASPDSPRPAPSMLPPAPSVGDLAFRMPIRANSQNSKRPAFPGPWLRAANSRSGNRVLAACRGFREILFPGANPGRAAAADSGKPSRWLYPPRPPLLERQECHRLAKGEGAWCRRLDRGERGLRNLD